MSTTRMRIAAVLAAAAAALAVAGSAEAAVFQASASYAIYTPPGVFDPVTLPKYAGPGRILGVTLSISGSAAGINYYPYYAPDGITVASFPASWDVALLGPGADAPSPPLALQAHIATEFSGGSIPGCGDPSCGGFAEAVFGTPTVAFSASAPVSDLADFQGSGDNLFYVIDGSFFDNNFRSVTVTETITAVPEPGTWALWICGAGLLGAALRRRPRVVAA